ncbi:Uncharacterized membrane-anchored protein [Methylomagnum ishizawai]|uniref:Uncharacterized membrane-anchored protein n=1 Tax=Methylomagnum ishizawai TaxID=1760988 RepID=A0A1Y6D628_9GAMM|nr:DUF2167 domain-containing protein [Methylomagnum ishizawai]SMF95375.1 Uncharacterized membrane-anchored protein [Methylomagnum ishizawai]
MNSFRRPAPWLLLLAVLATATAQAAPELPETTRSQLETAFQAVDAATLKGPTDVAIAGQAVLQLPSGYHFVPAEPARQLLVAMGNPGADPVQGMIFPAREQDAPWFIVVSFNPAGYIKDDEAKDWKADALLEEIRKGTASANEERRTRGLPEITVAGWVEAPQYDPETHRLVWSLSSQLAGSDQPSGVNYNTLMLGREGYISLNLVTDLASIERLKPVSRNMLASLDFDAGKRYADFQPDTDKVAEYGLAALVAGVAAKKLGLLALAGLFFAKFAKIILAGAVVAMGGLARVFGGKKKPEA